jgi:hypothetical protein
MSHKAIEASSNSFNTHHTSPQRKPPLTSVQHLSTSTSANQPPLGSKEHFRGAVTAKRKKPSAAPYPKKKPTKTPMKETKFASSPNMRLMKCGFLLYVGKKPGNDPLLFNIKQTVDINNPYLFEELCDQLLERFTLTSFRISHLIAFLVTPRIKLVFSMGIVDSLI